MNTIGPTSNVMDCRQHHFHIQPPGLVGLMIDHLLDFVHFSQEDRPITSICKDVPSTTQHLRKGTHVAICTTQVC